MKFGKGKRSRSRKGLSYSSVKNKYGVSGLKARGFKLKPSDARFDKTGYISPAKRARIMAWFDKRSKGRDH
jgi:hypothetical protein